jgi:NSS family neurotransmitter:Na+ symporter
VRVGCTTCGAGNERRANGVSGRTETRGHWSSGLGFVLAAAGSAVGLGNIWKFPYITGRNGGGAFLLIYVGCIVFIGMPILLAEFLIGRKTERNPVGAFRALRPGTPWVLAGWLGVASGFVILSYYGVVAGWVLDYVYLSLGNRFSGLSPGETHELFTGLTASLPRQMWWQGLFMALTITLVAGGVQRGIERGNEVMMPLLVLFLGGLLVYAATTSGAGVGYEFMLRPRWDQVTPQAFLDAMGQAFFSLSLGMGAMVTYGSYLARETNLFRSAWYVAASDTGIALLAGLVIFPLVFTFGLEPAAGPGLLFRTLPVAFAQLPASWLIASLFFLLLTFAALSSAISLLEVVVAYFVDERGWSRPRAAFGLGAVIFLCGIPSAMGESVLAFMDALASNYMLPIGGLATAVFAGWVLTGHERRGEFIERPIWLALFRGWSFLLRYVSPVAVAIVFLQQAGLLAWLWGE